MNYDSAADFPTTGSLPSRDITKNENSTETSSAYIDVRHCTFLYNKYYYIIVCVLYIVWNYIRLANMETTGSFYARGALQSLAVSMFFLRASSRCNYNRKRGRKKNCTQYIHCIKMNKVGHCRWVAKSRPSFFFFKSSFNLRLLTVVVII